MRAATVLGQALGLASIASAGVVPREEKLLGWTVSNFSLTTVGELDPESREKIVAFTVRHDLETVNTTCKGEVDYKILCDDPGSLYTPAINAEATILYINQRRIAPDKGVTVLSGNHTLDLTCDGDVCVEPDFTVALAQAFRVS